MKQIIFIVSVISLLSAIKVYSQDTLIKEINNKFNDYIKYLPQEKVYLHVDRPFYKPGDDIWFSAWLVDGISNKPSPVSQIMYVELIDPKGNSLTKSKLIVKNGKAKGDFQLTEEAPGGMYKIKAYTNWMKNFGEENFFKKEIQVQAALMPKLLMNLDFKRKAFGPGDKVEADFTLATTENQPLGNFVFNIAASIEGKELMKVQGKTDEKGKSVIAFKLPDSLASNDGLLNVMIDYQGFIESISHSIPIVLNKIDLQFMPEGGEAIANVESRIAFKAMNEFGKPADIEGIVIDAKGNKVATFKSYHQGMGAFWLKPGSDEKYIAKITKPDGIKEIYPLPVVLICGY